MEVGARGGGLLEKRLRELSKRVSQPAEVRVGFLEDATYPDGTSVASVAAINNFGAPGAGIPARPFFSNMVARESAAWGSKLAKLLELNDYDAVRSLTLMGEGIAGQLRKYIVDTNEPPNSPVTDLLKQRFPMGGQTFEDVQEARADVENGETAPAGKPLVHTGVMLAAVDYEVRENGKKVGASKSGVVPVATDYEVREG